ncbi:MAG: hypothetical protein ACM3Q9_00385 [Methanosarcina sp.]
MPRRRAKVLFVTAALLAFFGLSSSAVAAEPVITIDAPTSVSYTSVHLSGTIDPKENSPYYFFEVSTDPSFAEWTNGAWQGPLAENTGPVAVSDNFTGLKPGTQYYVRLMATNFAQSWFSPEPNPSFTTEPVPPPAVSIDPPTSITGHTAHFSGEIDPGAPAGNPSAFDVSWRFECTPSCPGASGSIPADSEAHEVSAEATGLLPGTQYEVRLVAENAGGPASAGPELFTTEAVPPEIGALKVHALRTEANVEATFNPGGLEATYHFEYGPSTAYGSSTPDVSIAASGQPTSAKATLTGLSPASQYHVRLVVTNSLGTAEGAAKSFQTQDPSGAGGGCPNEAIRFQQGSVSLPDCRAYELVSPAEKNGGNLSAGLTATADGSRVASISSASFGDAQSNELNAPYVSERTPTGWRTANLAPPLTGGFALNGFLQAGAFTSDLGAAITSSRAYGPEMERKNILLTTLTGETVWVTKPTQPNPVLYDKYLVGHSADGSRVFFESKESYSPVDTFEANQVWEWHAGQVNLVSVMPDGSPAPAPNGAMVGSGFNAIGSGSTAVVQMLAEPTAISSDGSRAFFTVSMAYGPQLFVRENGAVTKELSLSQKPGSIGEEAGPATFIGAARDGSKVLFSSEAELTAGATPGGGIYRYDLESGELEFLTPDPGGSPQIQGVAAISDDGGRVYFVAGGQLLAGEGEPGGHNLYYADGDEVRFIASLAERDMQDWSSYLSPRASRITPDGAHIAFQSARPLSGYEQEGHVEIFKWDLATGSLACASCGPPGSSAGGDASLLSSPVDPETGLPYNGQVQTGNPRGMSEDGSQVFFETNDSLDPRDINGRWDVYAWEGGHTHLISGGIGTRDSEIIDNSADGRNVFFSTSDSLLPADVDHGAQDIYDARIDGGFDESEAAAECEGGDCQGGAPPPPQFSVPGSSQLRGAGNAKAAQRHRALKKCARKKTPSARRKCRRAVKKHFGRTATSTRKGA